MRSKTAFASFILLVVSSSAVGQEIAQMKHEGGVHTIAFSPDGRYLATGGNDSSARVWEVPGGREVARLTPQMVGAKGWAPLDPYGLAFSPDGRYLATENFDATVRVWELASGRVVARVPTSYPFGHGEDQLHVFPYGFAFSPDGRYLATASDDRVAVRIWEWPSAREVARLNHDRAVYDIAFSPDGRYLATASDDRTARVWEVAQAKEVARLNHEGSVFDVAFSPDGRYLATGSRDGARVWEALSGREVARMTHKSRFGTIAFSLDGRYLATSWVDGTEQLWDAASGQEVARMKHGSGVHALAFSPDGQYLATADAQGNVKLWFWRPPGPNSEGAAVPAASQRAAFPLIPSSSPRQETKVPEAQPSPTPKAGEWESDDPRQAILSARTISVVGEFPLHPGPTGAKKQLQKAIQKWGRFRVVEDPAEADLVLVIIEGSENEEESEECHTVNREDEKEEVCHLVGGNMAWSRLRVFKGGQISRADAIPLWDSGVMDDSNMHLFKPSDWFRTPAVRTVKSFRKFVEGLEKSANK